MQVLPLIFCFRDAVEGRGFLAGVQVEGLAIMDHEDGEWWMSGVQPAGVADYGKTEAEAYAAFRDTFRKVLFDSAELTQDFNSFKADVEKFFNQVDRTALDRWKAARQGVRDGGTCDGYAAELPRETGDVEPKLRVVHLNIKELEAFEPAKNKPDAVVLAVPKAA